MNIISHCNKVKKSIISFYDIFSSILLKERKSKRYRNGNITKRNKEFKHKEIREERNPTSIYTGSE